MWCIVMTFISIKGRKLKLKLVIEKGHAPCFVVMLYAVFLFVNSLHFPGEDPNEPTWVRYVYFMPGVLNLFFNKKRNFV